MNALAVCASCSADRRPIDSLKLTCTWQEHLLPSSSSASARVCVEGMLLQGCAFVEETLSPAASDAPSLSLMPPCLLAYIDKACCSSSFTVASWVSSLCVRVSHISMGCVFSTPARRCCVCTDGVCPCLYSFLCQLN